MQSVEKPMASSFRPRSGEDALVGITLGPVRQERDDGLSWAQALGDAQRSGCGGAGGASREEALLAGERAARVEGFLVADLDRLVHETAVEDRPDLRQADALDVVRSGRAAAEDRALRLDGHAQQAGVHLREVL